jgi:hypothetical protein
MILNIIENNKNNKNKYFNKLAKTLPNKKLREKDIIFKNYYKHIRKKIYSYKLVKEYNIFSKYKVVLLRYNKIMIIKLNQNLNYFKNIYKSINIKNNYE